MLSQDELFRLAREQQAAETTVDGRGAQTVGGAPFGGNPFDNNAFTAGDISNKFDPNGAPLGGLPTLAAGSFGQGEGGNWSYNGQDPFLNTMMNTAGYGRISGGLDAFTQQSQMGQGYSGTANNVNNMFAMMDPNIAGQKGYSTATLQSLAGKFGIDPNDPQLQAKLQDAAKDYIAVSGMGGLNPNDPRQVNQILYKKQADGSWAPVAGDEWSQREKGGYITERPGVLAPFAVLGAGVLAGALGAGGAGAASGAAGGTGAGTAGATGYGSLYSGVSGLGSAAGGAGGINFTGYGLVGGTTGGLGGTGVMGGGALGAGALGGGMSGAWGFSPVGMAEGGISAIQAGNYAANHSSLLDRVSDRLQNEGIKRGLNQLLGGNAGGGGGSPLGGLGGSGFPQLRSGYAANDAVIAALLNKDKTPAERADRTGTGEDTGYLLRALRQGAAGS